MTDSDPKEKPVEAPQEKPKGPTAITVRAGKDKFRQMLKDPSSGKFLRMPKKMPDSREVTRFLRNLGNSKLEVGPDGRLTKSSKSLIQNMTENICRIAMYDGNDPKMAAAAVAGYETVMARMWGKTSMSDQDAGALERAGVKIVVISAPALPNEGELVPREMLKPSFSEAPFIDGELVENPKSN